VYIFDASVYALVSNTIFDAKSGKIVQQFEVQVMDAEAGWACRRAGSVRFTIPGRLQC
jgi:hypothetical protein